MALNAKLEKRFLESSLFSGCDNRSFRALAQAVTSVSMTKGQLLPQLSPALGLLLEGSIDVSSPSGVLYFTLEPGEFLEPNALYSELSPILPYRFRARTNCVVALIGSGQLQQLIHDHPRVAENYIRILADKYQMTVCRLEHFTAATPSVALGMYLLRNQKGGSIRLADGFAGLARRLNISRATLYRSLADLEQIRLVEHHDKTVHIIDEQKLQEFVMENSCANGTL